MSLLVAAVETGGGGRVLEDPDGLVLTAAIPPKLYCTLRIPPADGLTARAIPVALNRESEEIASNGVKVNTKKTHLVLGQECY